MHEVTVEGFERGVDQPGRVSGLGPNERITRLLAVLERKGLPE
jgi:hypothetical protein